MNAGIPCLARTAVGLSHAVDACGPRLEGSVQLVPILGAVVDHDDLEVVERLRVDRPQRGANEARGIVDGNDDADLRHASAQADRFGRDETEPDLVAIEIAAWAIARLLRAIVEAFGSQPA